VINWTVLPAGTGRVKQINEGRYFHEREQNLSRRQVILAISLMLFINTAPKTILTHYTFSVWFTIRPFMTTSVKYVFRKMNFIFPYTIRISW